MILSAGTTRYLVICISYDLCREAPRREASQRSARWRIGQKIYNPNTHKQRKKRDIRRKTGNSGWDSGGGGHDMARIVAADKRGMASARPARRTHQRAEAANLCRL